MFKDNDIQVNKVNKWDYGVVDMSLWHLKDEFDALVDKLNSVYGIDVFEIEELTADTRSSMDKVLDRFNELEAVHQKDTGMITEYEEENRSLREQMNGLINARITLTRDNDDLRRERDRHIDLLDKLRWALEDKGIRVEWNERAFKWNLYDNANICESCNQHYEDGLRIRCEDIDDKNKLIDELKQTVKDLESKNRKDIAYGYFSLIASLREQIETLEKENETLKKENEELKAKNRSLQLRMNVAYGSYKSTDNALKKMVNKVTEFDKENKELKDTLNEDRKFGKYVGERVAESIREGCDKGAYELHPYTRIDIHVEETNNMPTTFDRHAIPRVSVIFNNTQTEMERDTAQHECEELDKKFKELAKENIDLKTTLALCERDANMARELCHTVAFNAERARNKTPWFNE